MIFPSSASRVRSSTSTEINQRIEHDIALSVERCFRDPQCIQDRLDELDREWDVERVLEANASALVLGGAALGTFVHRGFYALSAGVAAFLLQHALQGWCPPLPILRQLGFRTVREIETERHSLKALRGDYDNVSDADNPVSASIIAAEQRSAVPTVNQRLREHFGE